MLLGSFLPSKTFFKSLSKLSCRTCQTHGWGAVIGCSVWGRPVRSSLLLIGGSLTAPYFTPVFGFLKFRVDVGFPSVKDLFEKTYFNMFFRSCSWGAVHGCRSWVFGLGSFPGSSSLLIGGSLTAPHFIPDFDIFNLMIIGGFLPSKTSFNNFL